MTLPSGERFRSVGRFGDDAQVWLLAHHVGHAFAHHRVVIGHEDSDHLRKVGGRA